MGSRVRVPPRSPNKINILEKFRGSCQNRHVCIVSANRLPGAARCRRAARVVHKTCLKTAFYKSFNTLDNSGLRPELSTCILLGLYRGSKQRSSSHWCWFWPARARGPQSSAKQNVVGIPTERWPLPDSRKAAGESQDYRLQCAGHPQETSPAGCPLARNMHENRSPGRVTDPRFSFRRVSSNI
jgi:hypothetical protein